MGWFLSSRPKWCVEDGSKVFEWMGTHITPVIPLEKGIHICKVRTCHIEVTHEANFMRHHVTSATVIDNHTYKAPVKL